MKTLRNFLTESTPYEVNRPFSDEELENLRKSYGDLKTMDPAGDAYAALIRVLDGMPQAQIRQLALAKIPFVSQLAHNRVVDPYVGPSVKDKPSKDVGRLAKKLTPVGECDELTEEEAPVEPTEMEQVVRDSVNWDAVVKELAPGAISLAPNGDGERVDGRVFLMSSNTVDDICRNMDAFTEADGEENPEILDELALEFEDAASALLQSKNPNASASFEDGDFFAGIQFESREEAEEAGYTVEE